MKKTLFALFSSALAILLFYAMMIHPFEVPDENAHFSSLTYLADTGHMPSPVVKDNLSIEELKVEDILGIVEGANKYSYHPEYRVEQVDGPLGKYEELIRSYNTTVNRTTYHTFQAAIYPPLYYILTLPLYHLVAHQDILTRLFVSRLSSVILTSFTIVIAYLAGYAIYRTRRGALTIALLTLFYPMTTYIGSGVNSDNLHNLLFGIATLAGIKVIDEGWSPRLALGIGTLIGLDLLTKPQAYILFPIFVLATIIRWKWLEWRSILSAIFYVLVPVFLLAGWQEIPKFMGSNPYLIATSAYTGLVNFRIFIASYLHTHVTEMPVWYWGVFKWFGVVLPRPWWWIGTRLIAVSCVGIFVEFSRNLLVRKLSRISRLAIFMLIANLLYAVALLWFDWQFYEKNGRSLGLQARYYMPLLISQMSLLYMGIMNLGWRDKVKGWFRTALIFFFLGLQLTSVYVQLKSYYDLAPLSTFINQLSQYKPWFAKVSYWYLWFPLYLSGIAYLMLIALKKNKHLT